MFEFESKRRIVESKCLLSNVYMFEYNQARKYHKNEIQNDDIRSISNISDI